MFGFSTRVGRADGPATGAPMNAPMSRRSFVRLGGISLLAALAASGAAGCASKPSLAATSTGLPRGITIGTQQIPNDEEIAKAQGLLEKLLGCPVTLTQFKSGRDVNNALVANSIDMGELGSAPASLSIANRVPVRVIWIHQVLGDIEALAVKKDAGIRSVEDLKGKRVATPFASTAHYSLMRCLGQHKMGTSDITLLDMQPADIYAAWARGDIDAAYAWQPVLGKLLAEGGEMLLSSEDMAKTGVVTSNVELVRSEFAERYPQVVAAYVGAMDAAVKAYYDQPQQSYASVGKAIGVGTAAAKVQMVGASWMRAKDQTDARYLGDGTQVGKLADYLEDCAKFMVTQQCLLEVPERSVFENAVDPRYVQRYVKGAK